ncbi:DUF5709 domain-containing protein [Streptomyces sp. NRRL S-87]|uniref:DUF5709 domain-containing protein n=1 Tax=Streptomyces sp. NRRL S-87 TaxID=1463920 RepID=UPI0004C02116|nr:DUF5709 domain-containing protein [Streptomyces sp. NRRL S-87]
MDETRDTEALGDGVYQPQTDAEPSEAQPDMENALGEPDLDATLDSGYSPPDRPVAATRHGTTAAEQRTGETLDQRLAEEEPEPPGEPEGGAARRSETAPDDDLAADADAVGDAGRAADAAGREPGEDVSGDPDGDASTAGRARAGRIAQADEPYPSRHISLLAHDTGIDGGAASAEEAAMHVIDAEPTER